MNEGRDLQKEKHQYSILLLLLLSCFSCVQLCATPETAAYVTLGKLHVLISQCPHL